MMAIRKKHVHVHYLLFALAQPATLPSPFHSLAVVHEYTQDVYRDDACARDSTVSSLKHKLDLSICVHPSKCIEILPSYHEAGTQNRHAPNETKVSLMTRKNCTFSQLYKTPYLHPHYNISTSSSSSAIPSSSGYTSSSSSIS